MLAEDVEDYISSCYIQSPSTLYTVIIFCVHNFMSVKYEFSHVFVVVETVTVLVVAHI